MVNVSTTICETPHLSRLTAEGTVKLQELAQFATAKFDLVIFIGTALGQPHLATCGWVWDGSE